MADIYEIESGGEVYEIEADTREAALEGFRSMVGGPVADTTQNENPQFTPGYNRVKELQQNRPGVFRPIKEAWEGVKDGSLPHSLINVKPDEYFIDKGITPTKGIEIGADVGKTIMAGAELMAVPYKAVESPIALAAVEAQAGNFQGMPGAFIKGVLDTEVGEYGDLIRTRYKDPTKTNEFMAGTFGLLTSVGIGAKLFGGLGKNAQKFRGTGYVKKQVKEAGKAVDLLGKKTYAMLDDFYTKHDVPLSNDGVASIQKVIDVLPSRITKHIKGKVSSLKDAWKMKSTVNKGLRTIWAKQKSGRGLTPADEALLNAYDSIDNVVKGSIDGAKNKAIYGGMNKKASIALKRQEIVKKIVTRPRRYIWRYRYYA